jgi:hypothetical protein
MKHIKNYLIYFFVITSFFCGNITKLSAATWSSNGSKLYYNGGNVGIGTSTPSEKLHIFNYSEGKMLIGADASSWWFWSPSNTTTKSTARMMVNGTFNNNTWKKREAAKDAWLIQAHTNTSNTGYYVINHADAGGSQTISKLPPALMIKANGKVYVRELIVSANTDSWWADYVFKDNYQLMPLEEVEKYIKENEKLPNIPTAEEIHKEGLPVGEMQKKQMEKIEELTLYVIDLDKKNKELEEQNKSLEERLERLENLLNQ